MSIAWAHPESLWALLPAAAWAWTGWWRGVHTTPVAPRLRHPALGATTDAPQARPRWPWLLQGLAVGLAVLALARPQEIGAWITPPPEGRDIALVVDTSLTMSLADFRRASGRGGPAPSDGAAVPAQDAAPVTRMAMLKAVLGDFVRQRTADRFSLAVFGSQAATLTPPTFDRDHVVAQLMRLQVGTLGDDTALADALGLALASLQPGRLAPVIVLVSDGEPTNAGDLTPAEAVAVARQLGVAIHTLQVGAAAPRPAGAAAPLAPPPSETEEPQPGLADIARLTGGRHWVAHSTGSVREVMRDIDRLAPTLQAPPTDRERREWFALPLGLALIAFALAHAASRGARG